VIRSTCRGVTAEKSGIFRVWDKVPGGNMLISGDNKIPLQHSVGESRVYSPLYRKLYLDPFSLLD